MRNITVWRSEGSRKQWVLRLAMAFLAGWIATGCDIPLLGEEKKEDRLLAKVYSKTLYLSELDGMFPNDATSQDSALIINAFVNRWVRETVVLEEAERNIPKDLNIDKLVRDYRASLIRHNYEKIIVEELLDSTITQAELIEFYERNKEQFQLETPILRCYFIKIPLPVRNQDDLRQWWNNPSEENLRQLTAYCNENADVHHLVDSVWYKVEEIALLMPKGTLTADNISSKREFIQRDDNFQYYFKVFEVKNRKELAPLSYIEDQARKVILHNRKNKLLQDKIENLYERDLRRNHVEIFTQ